MPIENSKIDENSNIASNVQSACDYNDKDELMTCEKVNKDCCCNRIDRDDDDDNVVEMDDGTVHNCQCNKMLSTHTKKLKSVGKSFR